MTRHTAPPAAAWAPGLAQPRKSAPAAARRVRSRLAHAGRRQRVAAFGVVCSCRLFELLALYLLPQGGLVGCRPAGALRLGRQTPKAGHLRASSRCVPDHGLEGFAARQFTEQLGRCGRARRTPLLPLAWKRLAFPGLLHAPHIRSTLPGWQAPARMPLARPGRRWLSAPVAEGRRWHWPAGGAAGCCNAIVRRLSLLQQG